MAKRKLRESARGRDCTIRIPGVCNFNPDTVVLCHVGRKRGIGKKCHDIHAIYACSDCHDVVDGRAQYCKALTEMIPTYTLEALEETQLIMLEEGLIKV
jgi:hypothetical protein